MDAEEGDAYASIYYGVDDVEDDDTVAAPEEPQATFAAMNFNMASMKATSLQVEAQLLLYSERLIECNHMRLYSNAITWVPLRYAFLFVYTRMSSLL